MKGKGTIGYEIRELSILFARSMEKKHPDMRVAQGPQGFALRYLGEHQDRPVFQKDLEEALSIRKSTASNLVQRLEKNGLVTVVSLPEDKRYKQIMLTDKAKADHQQIDADITAFEKKMKQGISQEELDNFFATIDKIKRNLQKEE